jgi:microcystin-dependent protein
MSKLNLVYDIVNLTPADANPVEANYNTIQQFVNQELIERDGSVAMRAELLLSNDPLTPLGAATKQYVDGVLPIGMITPFGGVGSPPGGKWLECNGAELATTDYPDLYAVLGTRYVTGTPAGGRFNLPNLVGKFPMGAGGTDALGTVGGSRNAVVVAHNHPIDHTHSAGTTGQDNAEHTHGVPNHQHSLNINSGTESAVHDHKIAGVGAAANLGPTTAGVVGDDPASGFAELWSTGQETAPHYHNVAGFTDVTGSTTTTGRSAIHQHTFQTPAFAGTSGAASGAAATASDKNLPPYLAVTWIIRAA